MRRSFCSLLALLAMIAPGYASGLMLPQDKTLAPLAMVDHQVRITIEDQIAVTNVEQTFRNQTNRQLEATYVFPVPRGASVNKFTMWVDGKETKGELLDANKARDIYTSIVRRTMDPGLLEYLGNDLLRLRVFPIPPNGDQRVAVRFTSVTPKEGKLIEYLYPLRAAGRMTQTLQKFSIEAIVKSQHGVVNVYSPTHALELNRKSDNEVVIRFDKNQGSLDRDFQLFYSTGKDDVGLTALTHRPVSSDKGYASLLISPRFSLKESIKIPRDFVLVMDTSGSMRGAKIEQAKKALKYCLGQLDATDRFAVLNFSTGVSAYEDKLVDATSEQIKRATKWVEELEATGGTAIDAALQAAFKLRPQTSERPFTVIFFTDGQPTIGETNPERIFRNVKDRLNANTRVFTFGVGDDVNAALLDQLAEVTRGVSSYVRNEEDIAHKVESFYGKISAPVLTNLKLTTSDNVRLSETYPPELPDLFSGNQLVVLSRFSGEGPATLKLTGKVGTEEKEFVYEFRFPDKTDDSREFVEQLWARRKVGYLLDQIRLNGETKELKDEVVTLAKKYGITTPYTSWLIVPDQPIAVPPGPGPGPVLRGGAVPMGLMPAGGGVGGAASPKPVLDFARQPAAERAKSRNEFTEKELRSLAASDRKPGEADAAQKKATFDRAREVLARRDQQAVAAGRLGVDLALQMQQLRLQQKVERSAVQQVHGRICLEVGGVWIDEGFTEKTEAVVVKALSDAYFELLRQQPSLKKVFSLGNHLVWITPSGKALVIDASHGKEKLTNQEIERLFQAKK